MPEPQRDEATVSAGGDSLVRLPHGVSVRELVTHVDDRGSVCELLDARWPNGREPMVYAYTFTVRPGYIKGWGIHRHHEDRYALLYGEMELHLYDDREDSPTHHQLSKVVLSEYRRRLVNIPPGIWHLDRNIGPKDAVVVNFPTKPYDHANPDKYRLPPNNDYIPIRFPEARGG